jgi:hypothetical protein
MSDRVSRKALERAVDVALDGLRRCTCSAIIFDTKRGDHSETCPRWLRERIQAVLLAQ